MTQGMEAFSYLEEPVQDRPARRMRRLRTPEPFLAVSHDAQMLDVPQPDVTPVAVVDHEDERPDWRLLVPAPFGQRFPELSEELFQLLADEAPEALAKVLTTEGLLDNAELTLAAEAMGRCDNAELVRRTLRPLLKHRSAVVREGAIYGLSTAASDHVRVVIEYVSRKDPHPGVRQAALATIDGWRAE